MTYEPKPDLEDVLYASGLLGYGGAFHETVPEGFTTATSGGATITTSDVGTVLNPGTTTDDICYIDPHNSNTDENTYDELEYEFILLFNLFPSDEAQGVRDTIRIGPSRTSGSSLMGYDPENEQYVAGSVTQSAVIDENYRSNQFLRVRVKESAETVIEHKWGDYHETVTLDDKIFAGRHQSLAVAESNGFGDRLNVLFARFTVHPV